MVRINSTAGVVDEIVTLGKADIALIIKALNSITEATRVTVIAIKNIEISSIILRVAVISSADN